jgi:hypothetical protein
MLGSWEVKKDTKVSISTMHRQLQKLRLTTKKTLYAKEQKTPTDLCQTPLIFLVYFPLNYKWVRNESHISGRYIY